MSQPQTNKKRARATSKKAGGKKASKKSKEPAEKKQKTVNPDVDAWGAFVVPKLVQILKDNNLAHAGNKPDLIKRLVEAGIKIPLGDVTVNWNAFYKQDLQFLCEKANLSVNGNKKALVARLVEAEIDLPTEEEMEELPSKSQMSDESGAAGDDLVNSLRTPIARAAKSAGAKKTAAAVAAETPEKPAGSQRDDDSEMEPEPVESDDEEGKGGKKVTPPRFPPAPPASPIASTTATASGVAGFGGFGGNNTPQKPNSLADFGAMFDEVARCVKIRAVPPEYPLEMRNSASADTSRVGEHKPPLRQQHLATKTSRRASQKPVASSKRQQQLCK